MKALKITFVLLFLPTIMFSQSKKEMMLSDKVKEIAIKEFNFDYDSAFKKWKETEDARKKTTIESLTKSLPDSLKDLKISTFSFSSPYFLPVLLDGKTVGKYLDPLRQIVFEKNKYEFEILKDKERTCIYGTMGMRKGVLLIKTKS